MKLRLLLFTALFILPVCARAQTETDPYNRYTENWAIPSFHSDIELSKNRHALVTETIRADFSNEAHRGILRQIPNNTKIEILDSSYDNDQNLDTKNYEQDGYTNIELRHPDNEYSSEKHEYILKYEAIEIINSFDETETENGIAREEFYWNVNGTDAPVQTDKVSATVTLPSKIDEENLMITCFTGLYGSQAQNCEWEIEEGEKTAISFNTTEELSYYEGLTIVIGMPAGTFLEPTLSEKILDWLKEYWPILIFPTVLLLMFLAWWKKGRDVKTLKTTVIPHYRPPHSLSASECGTIIDEKIDPKDITAAIIDFAVRGYIDIKQTQKKILIGHTNDYILTLKKPYSDLRDFERLIMEELFEENSPGTIVTTSQLEKKFYKSVKKIKKSIATDLVKKDFFPHDPEKIRTTYTTIGLIIAFFSPQILFSINPLLGISAILSGFTIAGFGYAMPRKTLKGAETYYELKGLYEYIKTAEKDRMKFQEEIGVFFEKLLPYAAAFGLISHWTHAFKDLLKTPPSWFIPHGSGNFSMDAFADSLTDFSHETTKNIATKPDSKGAWSGGSGFGGGGFSGGGFGGGGTRGL